MPDFDLLTPEQLAAKIPLNVRHIRRLACKTGSKRYCSWKFDERDIERVGRKILIAYQPKNAAGFFRPRVLSR